MAYLTSSSATLVVEALTFLQCDLTVTKEKCAEDCGESELSLASSSPMIVAWTYRLISYVSSCEHVEGTCANLQQSPGVHQQHLCLLVLDRQAGRCLGAPKRA